MSSRRVAYLDLDGTLLGPGGALTRGGDGRFSDAGVRALGALAHAGVPVVLVSGRRGTELRETARLLGADGAIAELGACEAGYPCEPGQSVHAAIAATGVPDRLVADSGGALAVYEPWSSGRQGTHIFRGRAGPEAMALVDRLSGGTLALVDNGVADEDGTGVYHLLPAAAGKARAVARDIAVRSADPAACLAVGDSRHDLELAAVVGHMALVANALDRDPSLAEYAPWITEASYGAGVLEAVQRWVSDPRPSTIARSPHSS